MYTFGVRLNLSRYFQIAGLLLVVFGAAILRYSVHEFEEVGLLPPLIDRVWYTGAALPEGTGFGAILQALIGYTSKPSLMQVLAYSGYYLVVGTALYLVSRRDITRGYPRGESPGELDIRGAGLMARKRQQALRTLALVGLSVLFVNLLAGCGGDDGGSSGAEATMNATVVTGGTVTITATDNHFEPSFVKVPAGQEITVTFVNAGQNVHEVEIKGLVSETSLQPGEEKSFTFTPEQQSYKLYCEIHEDEGMEGEFIGQ